MKKPMSSILYVLGLIWLAEYPIGNVKKKKLPA